MFQTTNQLNMFKMHKSLQSQNLLAKSSARMLVQSVQSPVKLAGDPLVKRTKSYGSYPHFSERFFQHRSTINWPCSSIYIYINIYIYIYIYMLFLLYRLKPAVFGQRFNGRRATVIASRHFRRVVDGDAGEASEPPPGKDHQGIIGKSPCLKGKSPFLMGKSTCLMGKSPFLMGKSPFFIGKSPFLMGKSQFLIGKSLFFMGKSPFLMGKSTRNCKFQ